jgi:small subunit ribosomal protein S8
VHIIVASYVEDLEDTCVSLKCVVFVLEKTHWKVYFLALRKLVGKRRIQVSVDAIGDFLTIIRNGLMVSKRFVVAPYSRMRLSVAKILQDEGFIQDVAVLDDIASKKSIKVTLRYVNGESAIHRIDRRSTPGRRLYTKVDQIKPVIGGLGLSILSTNRGVVSHKKAKEYGVGGEVICTVW